jgi:hypothetical protein
MRGSQMKEIGLIAGGFLLGVFAGMSVIIFLTYYGME